MSHTMAREVARVSLRVPVTLSPPFVMEKIKAKKTCHLEKYLSFNQRTSIIIDFILFQVDIQQSIKITINCNKISKSKKEKISVLLCLENIQTEWRNYSEIT